MANENHLRILRQGSAVWNQWRADHSRISPDLRAADLSGADLSEADLSRADLSRTDLRETDLRWVDLSAAVLNETDLTGALLSYSRLGSTIFGNVDLSAVKGLETVVHWGPSTIGIDTIYRSKGNIPQKFLFNAGVAKADIAYLLSLASKAVDASACLISYSTPDQDFAEYLHADLQARGIRCWLAPAGPPIEEAFRLGMDQGLQRHDKQLLVLSEHSVGSGWVQDKVLSLSSKAPGVLFPIRLDDAILDIAASWAQMLRQARPIGNFTQWQDPAAYQKALARLIGDLKTPE